MWGDRVLYGWGRRMLCERWWESWMDVCREVEVVGMVGMDCNR